MTQELAVELALKEHGLDRAVIRQLHALDRDLSQGGIRAVQPVLSHLLDDMVRRFYREMRQEEVQLYPRLAPVLGTDVPVLALVAEHHTIRDLVYDLRRLNRPDQPAWDPASGVPPLRAALRRLAQVLELHLRREESAFGALIAAGAA